MATVATGQVSTTLQGLVDSIRASLREILDPKHASERVAATLQPYLRRDNLLLPEQREPDLQDYRQHILHVEPDGSFSVVALIWLPGQSTPIHDHVSWCVVGVYEGQEHEVRYQIKQDGAVSYLTEDGQGTNATGSTSALTPPGDIHRVANQGPGQAISMHVYGADIGRLGSSIRRRYDLEVRSAPAGPS